MKPQQSLDLILATQSSLSTSLSEQIISFKIMIEYPDFDICEDRGVAIHLRTRWG
jgi:hypothetical protein